MLFLELGENISNMKEIKSVNIRIIRNIGTKKERMQKMQGSMTNKAMDYYYGCILVISLSLLET